MKRGSSTRTEPTSQPVQETAAPEPITEAESNQLAQTEPETPAEVPEQSGSNILVLYFSRTGDQYNVGVIEKGNTAIVAEMIGEATGANLYEILPADDHYPMTYKELTDVALQEQRSGARPVYAGDQPDMSGYDTIFIETVGVGQSEVAAHSMVDAIGDRYAAYFTKEEYEGYYSGLNGKYKGGIGISIYAPGENGALIQRVYEDTFADEAGLKGGDIVTAVDGVSVIGMSLDEMTDRIGGDAGTTVDITVTRGDETLTFTVMRGDVYVKRVDSMMLENKIGYIYVSSFTGEAKAEFESALAKLEDDGASNGRKRVYLTFDDGPSVYTGQILDTLKKYNAKATFFVCGTGDEDEALRPYYKRIVDEGHVIGMHSYSHVYGDLYYSAESFEYDLDKIRNLIYNETGIATSIYRFPGGSANTVSAHEMSTYIPILYAGGIEYYDWNVYPGDASGGGLSSAQIVSNTLKGVDKVENAIVVLHDTGAKKSTVEALPEILESLRERDCEILPFDENTPVIHQYEMDDEQ